MNTPTNYTLPQNKALILRTCSSDMQSYRGFKWPESGPVECPDWNPEPECGSGLHGWLWGEGDGYLGNWSSDAKWLVVEVDECDIIDLNGKAKFPRGVVAFCGDRAGATGFLRTHDPNSATRSIIGGTAKAGDRGIATVGDRGTAKAGYKGTANAGNGGTATAGDFGTAIAGHGGVATARDFGTATAWDRGTAIAGDFGNATAWDKGTAIAGYKGTATAGHEGTAIAGDCGTAIAGFKGTVKAGVGGVIVIQFWNEERYRMATAAVDGDKIKPNTPYQLNDDGEFVEAGQH